MAPSAPLRPSRVPLVGRPSALRGARLAFAVAFCACSPAAKGPAATTEAAGAKVASPAATPAATPNETITSAAQVMVSSSMGLAAASGGNLWLHTHAKDLSKAKDPIAPGIYRADGTPFMGRGAVIHDTRGCDSCDWRSGPNPNETMRRIDVLVDGWHANFLRLAVESYSSADQGTTGGATRASWQSLLYDDAYLAALKQIVDYIGTKPGVYVYLSIWRDASLSTNGLYWPTADSLTAPGTLCDTPAFAKTPTTTCTWRKLAQTFKDYPYVMFGVDGEPGKNDDGSQDATVWQLLNDCVQTIRDVEDAAGTPHHVVLVPGTRDYARDVSYFAKTGSDGKPVLHAITAGKGDNVAYETHPYTPASKFTSIFLDTAQYLPVVVGEFGPVYMDYNDMATLVSAAEASHLPYIGWTFHPNCGPASMITESTTNQCDGSQVATIAPNTWGSWLKSKIAANLTDDPTYTNPVASTPNTSVPSAPAAAVTNLARGKATVQSSSYSATSGSALAVDGTTDGAWANHSVAHTADRPGTQDPYWQVDLGAVHKLSQLVVYNRTDSLSERLEGLLAFISSEPFTTTNVASLMADAGTSCVRLGKYLNGAKAQADLANVQGRYVRLVLPGPGHILALAEVQVMGI